MASSSSSSSPPGQPDSQAARQPQGTYERYLPGDLIAEKYRLTRVLGKGGMGVVWVARNLVLQLDVAIKLLGLGTQSHRSTLAQRQRGLQEARTAAQLGHPAICRALDFGETHLGDPFVVNELLHGETLASVLGQQRRLAATEAVQILLPIIDGLAVAHAQAIVHRDVKSDNIFLARDVAGRMQPKLLDFGIARFIETDISVTLEGTLLGTPSYMSPEQARGEAAADFRTDIWSSCVVLYEAATGEFPFTGDNYNAVLWNVINKTPKSIVERGGGDRALWKVLERGLCKDPEERWQSMRELGEALALWLYEHGLKEDICGTSLRATWLEAGLSEVKLELPDSMPPKAPGEQAAEVPAGEDQPSVEPAADEKPAAPDTLVGVEPALAPPRRRRKLAVAAIGATTLLLGAVLAATMIPASEGGKPSAEPLGAASAKVAPTQAAPAAAASANGSSAASAAATTSASSAPPAAEPQSRPPPKPRARAKRRAKRRKLESYRPPGTRKAGRDFGF